MRQWCVLLAGVTLVGTPLSLKAGVVESYESGVGNVTLDAGENSPTVEQSPLFATDGVSSAKFTLNGDWLWRWNTHNVLPALEDVASSQYLVFDFTVASGQFKLGGIAANGNGGWKQQDAWNDALTQPGGAGQILNLPTYVGGENRGFGTFVAGDTGTFVWDYVAAGFAPAAGDTYLQFALNLQGPAGSVIHLDNLRVTGNAPQPPQYVATKLFSWETPDDLGTPVNEQLEGWTQGSPGFSENTHIHSISSQGATDGASSLQIDRTGTASGFTWGSQRRFDAAGDPAKQAVIDDLVSKINGATSIAFDVRFDDSYPNSPGWTKFGMFISDGTSFFDGEAASINGTQTIGATHTVTIPLSSLNIGAAGANLADLGLVQGTTGLGFGISVNTDGGGVYQIDNLRLLTEVPGLTADFNDDGYVDGGDLTAWKGQFGTGNGADADGDGDSDGADFLAWQREFGMGVPPTPLSATVASVPEPGALVTASLGMGLIAARRRRWLAWL